jgi:hypothetical protein
MRLIAAAAIVLLLLSGCKDPDAPEDMLLCNKENEVRPCAVVEKGGWKVFPVHGSPHHTGPCPGHPRCMKTIKTDPWVGEEIQIRSQ